MRTWPLLAFCVVRLVQAGSDTQLPDDFYSAQPSVQLFKAYAEFKMANYETARLMWQSIDGSARAEALFNLGILYDDGLGVTEDLEQALSYYSEAAKAGSRSAAYRLGLLYLRDPRMATNTDEARYWLSRAALDGDKDAAALLKGLTDESSESSGMQKVESLLLEDESAEAVALLTQLAEQGDTAAMNRLAWIYESGVHVEKDLSRAAQLFERAAELGDAGSQYALGVMLMTGVGLEQDSDQAKHWLKQAAAQGHVSAKRALREMQ
ncbi:tetratricopeptide repeat protein [Marinobacterium sp. YM272]|uniref:tetratricopeptide repeat protein n=1 Tax=Marinobacterium sp. YM272 TaxID=3421654 RepID=UPI003D7F791C